VTIFGWLGSRPEHRRTRRTRAGFLAAVTLAAVALVPAAAPAPALAAVPEKDWLHTNGNKIVDAAGNQVWLTGTNWFGFNASERVFHGLWSANINTVTRQMAERGINIVRVPISTQLLLEWRAGTVVSNPNVNVFANPELSGMNNLQIWDYWLQLCEQYGIKVMLDVHSADADNSGHIYPVWYKGSITPEQFYVAWEWVTTRYRNNDTIVAMDIKNEPHGGQNESPRAKWDGSTDQDNFKFACETAGRRILAINPELLILCEGIQIYPRPGVPWTSTGVNDYFNTWWGGQLRGVATNPVNLGANQDQLVYSPHDYGPLVFNQPWFQTDFTKASLTADVWRPNWLYIHENNTAPLLVGEWGGRLGQDPRQDRWMFALRDLMIENGIHHTFWVLNPNSGDTGGLLRDDWVSWDEQKYAMLKPALWQSGGKFVGLDHQVRLGGANSTTGLNLADVYGGGTGDTSPPTAPPGLTSTGTTATSVSLSWGASTDNTAVTGYDVFRGGVKVNTAPVAPGTRTFTDTGLTASTTYSYTVRAFDAAGNNSAASTPLSVTTGPGTGDTSPPTVPGNLRATGTTASSVSLAWNAATDNSGSVSYDVFRNQTQVNTAPLTGLTFTDSGLSAATTYQYTVRARDPSNNVSAQSAALAVTTQGGPTGAVRVEYKNGDGASGVTDNQIRPHLRIANPGTSALSLATVSVRYYFTREGVTPVNVFCDWAVVGCANLRFAVVALATPVTGADAYLEITFTSGSVAANANSGDIQLRLAKNDWSNFNEANDYSRGTNTAYANATTITGFVGGTLSWGTAPA
jgi:endoglucanase